MKKLITLLVVAICLSIAMQAKTTTEKTTVLFNTAKHYLTATAVKGLSQFIKSNTTHLDYEVTIEGHTDSRGNIKYNHNLSLNRAEEVKQFLIQHGIDEKLILIKYKGELDPERPNVNDKNRTVNRRVEVTFTTYSFDNIEELEAALHTNKPNLFAIQPDQENIVKGRKGVKILIKPNTFVYEDGTPVTETINLELTESLDYQDFIASGLLTKSADAMLESGGMIKVSATTISGKPVKVKADMEMVVAIPNKDRKDDMEVFLSDKGSDWYANNQPITKKPYSMVKIPFPKMRNNNIKMPHFKVDKKNEPQHPKAPKSYRNPHVPKMDSYHRNIAWYKLNKEAIRDKQELAYQKAVDRYDKRVEKYEANMLKYNQNMLAYKKACKDYLVAIDCWKEELRQQRQEFKKTPEYRAKFEKHQKIYQNNLAQHKKNVEKWRAKRKIAMDKAGEDMDKLGITNQQAMDNYIFTFNQLSWINVDRFYHMKEKDKQLITLQTESIEKERVLILFKNITSMLPMTANHENNEYVQNDFPKNEEAVIFAYKVENGKAMLCYREIDGSQDYQLDYVPTSFAEIKEILGQFNG